MSNLRLVSRSYSDWWGSLPLAHAKVGCVTLCSRIFLVQSHSQHYHNSVSIIRMCFLRLCSEINQFILSTEQECLCNSCAVQVWCFSALVANHRYLVRVVNQS